MTEIGKQLPGFVIRRAWERLKAGSPARLKLKRPAPWLLLRWLGLSLLLALGSLSLTACAFRSSLLWLLLALPCFGLSGMAAIFGLALDRVVPPAPRPDCQSPLWQGQKHPFFPFFQETPLLAYLPDQVWVAQIPLVFHGLQMGTRMTVIRASSSGELLVHSPIPLTPAIRQTIDSLGEIRWIVAPNLIHHLFVHEWLQAYPRAEAWASPNLAPRRPDIPWAGVLDTEARCPWERSLVDLAILRGHAFHQEVVLYHRPSRTLLLSDALENLGHRPETSAFSSWLFDWFGMSQRPTPPTDIKLSIVDEEACARSIRSILEWDFQRIILAHGRLIEEHAHDTFHDGWAFLLYR